MNVPAKPVSAIIKKGATDEPRIKSREEWRKEKELEEMRKMGTAPAAVDESGRDINPHIPQYIASAPWYIGAEGPTLRHQRPQPEKEKNYASIFDHYQRGVRGTTATKFRKGACQNCGAMTHQKKDCLERPRKIGAKYTNEDIAPDEMLLPDLKLDYDGKRDRWNGYDPEMYKSVVQEYEEVEECKRRLKEEKLKLDTLQDEPTGSEQTERQTVESDDEEEDDKYADKADMPGTKVDSKQRITVRNLRIREDTAKYLRNLDPESAYYDPKTRSMRDNPYKTTGKDATDLTYAGDNYVRLSGDTRNVSEAQVFAWQASERGVDVHLQAEPTKAELLRKEFKVKKEEIKETAKSSILEKYGGEEHLQAPPKELIFAQSEHYVEYSRQGRILKGAQKQTIRSIYEEDVYINNHTEVWGSYWKDGRWGYKCCHSFIKNSYCVGNKGREPPIEKATKIIELLPDDDAEEGIVDSEKSENKEGGEINKDKEAEATKIDDSVRKILPETSKASSPSQLEISSTMESKPTSSGSAEEWKTVAKKEKSEIDDEEVSRKRKRKESEERDLLEKQKDRKERKKEKRKSKKRKHREAKRSNKKDKHRRHHSKKHSSSSSSSSSDSSSSDSSPSDNDDEEAIKRKKLKKALKREREAQRQGKIMAEMDDRKRAYNSMYEVTAPTEEEVEAYQLLREREEDPMLAFMSSKRH